MHRNNDNNEADGIDLRFLNLSTGRGLQIMINVSYTDDMVNARKKAMDNETQCRHSMDDPGTKDEKNANDHWKISHFSREVRIIPPDTRLAKYLTQDISFEESDKDDGENPCNENARLWDDQDGASKSAAAKLHNTVGSYMVHSNLSKDQELAILPMQQHYQHLNNGVERHYSFLFCWSRVDQEQVRVT